MKLGIEAARVGTEQSPARPGSGDAEQRAGPSSPPRRLWKDPLFRGGLVLGAGLGGFLDGIVLHQILGWHHLVCFTETCEPTSIAELQRQNTLDGFFHLAVWGLTVWGIALVLRAYRAGSGAAGRIVFGATVAGWGLFNLVEGLIDHQILGIHHVRPESPQWLWYDLAFLALGVVLMIVGTACARRAARAVR